MLPIERMLLAGIDAAYDPAQQHQHSDLTLQIVRKGKVVRGDGSQAVDERIITRRAEARTQTEASEIKPTHLMARGLLASNGILDERFAEPANGRKGPRVSFCAEHRFHLIDESLGRQGSVVR